MPPHAVDDDLSQSVPGTARARGCRGVGLHHPMSKGKYLAYEGERGTSPRPGDRNLVSAIHGGSRQQMAAAAEHVHLLSTYSESGTWLSAGYGCGPVLRLR